MTPLSKLAISLCLVGSVYGQSPADPAQKPSKMKTPWFVDPAQLTLASVLSSPPDPDSATGKADLAEVRHVEQSRTPAEVKAAQYDDTHEDIFIYSTVLGNRFNSSLLPHTAALSAHLRNDAGIIDNPLKERFARQRPYNFDVTLHPVCETNKEGSYPSGHTLNGYLYAFTLAEIVPEEHDAILRRAEEYAFHRVVCGSHYVTDVQASRQIASFVFGYLLATPRYREELRDATTETRKQLHLPPLNHN